MTTTTHSPRFLFAPLVMPFVLPVALGLVACSPSSGDSGSSTGTGGVSVERSGGASGSGGGSPASGSGGSASSSGGGSGNPGSGGAAAGSGGGAPGSGGAKASGGSAGSSSGGSSGGATDASSGGGSDMASTMPPPSGTTDWVTCGGTSFKPGVSAMEFCVKYQSACGFGDPKTRYASLADCMTKYTALSDGAMGGKACVAWHLCIAATPDTKDVFCPHAPEASAMSGPCKAAYL
jgi:hypothetical protein